MTCKHVLTMEANGSAYLHHGVAGPWVCPWCQVERLEQELREARCLVGMMIAEAGGRLVLHVKTMVDFDTRQSVTHWDDPVAGHRIYALQTITTTAENKGVEHE